MNTVTEVGASEIVESIAGIALKTLAWDGIAEEAETVPDMKYSRVMPKMNANGSRKL